MDFSEHGHESSKKLVGITIVILIHILFIYALVHGLGTQIVAVIKAIPIQTVLIEESKPALPTPVASPTPPKKISATKLPVPAPEVPIQQEPAREAIQAQPAAAEQSVQKVAASETNAVKGPASTPAVVDFSTCSKPDYPRSALRNEEQGTVRLQFLIGLDGHVADSKIEKSSGFRSLDTAAKKALSLCRFKPGTIDGKPQQSWTVVDYVWKLPD